jgi:hypothetical protein
LTTFTEGSKGDKGGEEVQGVERESSFLATYWSNIEMALVDRPCAMELEFPFPGGLTSTFPEGVDDNREVDIRLHGKGNSKLPR